MSTSNSSVWKVPVLFNGDTGPTLLILDGFTDPNATNLASHAITPTNVPATSWTVQAGTLTIQSNKAIASAPNSIATLDAGLADGTIAATILTRNGGDGDRQGIIFRWQDSSNYWMAAVAVDSDLFQIVEITSGADDLRASTSVTVDQNTAYTIALTLSGNNMIATLNGGSQITHSSPVGKTRTKHGMKSGEASGGAPVTFDNFTVTTL